MSPYININGTVYKKEILEAAKAMATRKQEQIITFSEAQQLFVMALNFGFVTQIEQQSLQYVLEQYPFETTAATWLQQKLAMESPTQRAIKRTIWEGADLPGMAWYIEEQEVKNQLDKNDTFDFEQVLLAMLRSFMYQMESSESPRDIVSLVADEDLEDRDQITAVLQQQLKAGEVYLFPENYMALIEAGELPFTKPSFQHQFEDYWTFGMKMKNIPNWQFIGFVRRTDLQDTYNTGWEVA